MAPPLSGGAFVLSDERDCGASNPGTPEARPEARKEGGALLRLGLNSCFLQGTAWLDGAGVESHHDKNKEHDPDTDAVGQRFHGPCAAAFLAHHGHHRIAKTEDHGQQKQDDDYFS